MEFQQRLAQAQQGPLPPGVRTYSTGLVLVRSRIVSALVAAGSSMTALLLIAAALFAESTLAFTTQASAAVVCVLLALRAALHMVRPSAVLIIDRAGVRAGGRTIPWPAVRATQLLDNGLRVDVHDELEPGGDLVVTARGVRWSSAAALIERVAFDLPDADQSAS